MAILLDKTATLVSKVGGEAGVTLNITFTGTPAVGSLVTIPMAVWYGSVGPDDIVLRVFDNQGNGDYTILRQPSASGFQAECHLAYAIATNASGTFTVTLQLLGTIDITQDYIWIGAASFTGVSGTRETKGQAAPASLVTTLHIDTEAATTVANSLVIAVLHATSGATNMNILQTAGVYTNLYLVNDSTIVTGFRVDYFVSSGAGFMYTDWTHTSGSDAGLIATFPALGGTVGMAGSAGTGGTGVQTPSMAVPL